uniref:VWA domain-containing protein n=1 Tax=Pseudothermotoga hypogea TaxID=57487 RepID=A0A832I4N9_9THEM
MLRVLSLFFAFFLCLLFATQLQLTHHEVWWPDGLWNALWCSVTVKDNVGNFVRNLKLEDFKITEKAYGRSGELLGEMLVKFDRPDYQFKGRGFWEKSINSDKLDIAFFIDGTGSMEKHIDSIKEQLRNFLNRLIETGTDFRIFISMYDTENEPEWTVPNYVTRFFGPTMLEEIEEAIEEIETEGEWWNLTWGYDAYLWSLNLDWREDARKIVVIITDVYTDSVYGPNWYFASGCVTSMYAVDMAIRDTKIQLYYCQPDEEHMAKTELSENYSPQVNIAVKQNNFDKLAERNSSVKRLSWPFNQEEIELKQLPIVDSKYYFAWVSDWRKYSFVSRVEVEIALVPTGETARFVFYPLEKPDGTKTNVWAKNPVVVVKDERGLSLSFRRNVAVHLYKVMGDLDRIAERKIEKDENGVVNFGGIRPGRYYYILYANYGPYLLHRYHHLGYTSSGWIDITVDSINPAEIFAYTYGKAMELYRTKGLLYELENSKIATAEMKSFVKDASKWLEEITQNGITLMEMEAIKRFYVGLGSFVNMIGYASTTQERVTQDLEQIVQKATDMVRKAREVIGKLESAKNLILNVTNMFIDVVTTNWSGIAANVTIEQLIDRLVRYVRDELVDDIMNTVYNKLLEVVAQPERILSFFKSNVKTWVKQMLSPSQIGEVVESFVLNDLIYPQFTSHLEEELHELLNTSKTFVQENYEEYWDFYKRSELMRKSFEEMRKSLMGNLFDVSYKALTDKESIDNWQSVLLVFQETIPFVIDLLRLFEVRYPEFREIKEALSTLYQALDAIGTLTKTYEVALKVDYLNKEFQHRIRSITEAVYQFK